MDKEVGIGRKCFDETLQLRGIRMGRNEECDVSTHRQGRIIKLA
jgi:hypothetical protein